MDLERRYVLLYIWLPEVTLALSGTTDTFVLYGSPLEYDLNDSLNTTVPATTIAQCAKACSDIGFHSFVFTNKDADCFSDSTTYKGTRNFTNCYGNCVIFLSVWKFQINVGCTISTTSHPLSPTYPKISRSLYGKMGKSNYVSEEILPSTPGQSTPRGQVSRANDGIVRHHTEHQRTGDGQYPEMNITLAKNYCRDPDDTGHPWCYTFDPNVRYQPCILFKCF